jgi:subtilisin
MLHGDLTRRALLSSAGAAGVGTLALGTRAGVEDRRDEYNVGTATPAAERTARDAAIDVVRVLEWENGKKTVTGTFFDDAVDDLRTDPDMRYVERNGTMHATAQTLPWGVDRIDADVAHANGETGGDDSDGDGGTDIAIIDTGIDSDHPDLVDNLGEGAAFVECEPLSSRPGGCEFGIQTNENPCHEPWDDDDDHGSHVSGIADAVDNESGVVGVSTEATLHAVKVLDGCGFGSFSDIAAGIEWVADRGYDVANMSLGGGKSFVAEDAVEYAAEKGVLLVAAAGNTGPCSECVLYPAAEPEVVAVSATRRDDQLAGFSSIGSTVELAAPGDAILSTVPPESSDAGLVRLSGTSMASPHVAGTGAQLLDNGFTVADVRERLTATAEDLGLPADQQGSGLVDTATALGLGENGGPTIVRLSLTEDETGGSNATFVADWQVSVTDGTLESITLTLRDIDDDETEDATSLSVDCAAVSGTTSLAALGENGLGRTYEVELVVADSGGNRAAASASVVEDGS